MTQEKAYKNLTKKAAFTEPPTSQNPVENTPFMVVGNDTDGHMITIGNYGLTPLYKTPKEAQLHLSTNFWQVILNLLIIAPNLIKEIIGAVHGTGDTPAPEQSGL